MGRKRKVGKLPLAIEILARPILAEHDPVLSFGKVQRLLACNFTRMAAGAILVIDEKSVVVTHTDDLPEPTSQRGRTPNHRGG